jgi:hypothetical protein
MTARPLQNLQSLSHSTDQWGARAYRLDCTAEDVFGLHLTAPAARNDCKGLAWLLERDHVVAIDAAGANVVAEGVVICNSSIARLHLLWSGRSWQQPPYT